MWVATKLSRASDILVSIREVETGKSCTIPYVNRNKYDIWGTYNNDIYFSSIREFKNIDIVSKVEMCKPDVYDKFSLTGAAVDEIQGRDTLYVSDLSGLHIVDRRLCGVFSNYASVYSGLSLLRLLNSLTCGALIGYSKIFFDTVDGKCMMSVDPKRLQMYFTKESMLRGEKISVEN